MVDDRLKHEPGPEDIGFEHEDLRSRSVLSFLVALGIACVLVYFVLRVVYGFMETSYGQRQSASASPLAPPVAADTRVISPQQVYKFPEPRLESNERLELKDFRLAEERKLHQYNRDANTGQVTIPIERAMELIVERGLPVEQGNGTPASRSNAAMGQAGHARSAMPGTQYPGSPH